MKKPIFIFDDVWETGLDQVPEDSLIMIKENLDGESQFLVIEDLTGIDGSTDISTLLKSPELYSNFDSDMVNLNKFDNPLLHVPFINSLAINKGVGSVNFSRAGTATYVDRYGYLQTAKADEPRFEKEGLLIEGTSTNHIIDSNNFISTAWIKDADMTLTPGQVGPDGLNSATLIEKSGAGYLAMAADFPSNYFTVTTVTLSVWAKLYPGETNTRLDIQFDQNSTILTTAYFYLTDEWQRFTKTFTIDTTKALGMSVTGFSKYYSHIVHGFQVEALPFRTSYIPTSGTTVTRLADNCSITMDKNVGDLSKDFTFSIWSSASDNQFATNRMLFHVKTQDANNYIIRISHWTGTTTGRLAYYAGTQFTPGDLAIGSNTGTFSFTKKEGSIMSALDGRITNKDITIGTWAYDATPDTIYIGQAHNNNEQLYGHIRNFRAYDEYHSNLEMI